MAGRWDGEVFSKGGGFANLTELFDQGVDNQELSQKLHRLLFAAENKK